jgi:hypothetical protein
MRHYGVAAEVLRTLAATDIVALNGSTDALRRVLRTGAEACEQFDEANQKCSRALLRVAELEELLARAATVLETSPLPIDGVSWSAFSLAQEIRRGLDQG